LRKRVGFSRTTSPNHPFNLLLRHSLLDHPSFLPLLPPLPPPLEFNFDAPDAFDTPAMVACLTDLRAMKPVDVPVYDFATHQRSPATAARRVHPADVVIVEGILVLHMPEVRALLNMKVYVDTDDDVRLARRIQRDVAVRGRDVAGVIEQYTKFVKPAFDAYVAPSRKHADVIIPWGRDETNLVAIDLITEHARSKLQVPDLRRVYPNLELIPSNFQVRGMHTIIRDRETASNDFVFYADRLLRLVVEAGLGFLPFAEKRVTTPTGAPYVGVDFAKKLCGVSVIRSGESMENALRACCKGIKIGKVLVHRHGDKCTAAAAVAMKQNAAAAAAHAGGGGGGQETPDLLVYEKLPKDIADRHVLLMDPILATGNSAVRAIQVLLDRGVAEERILFLTLVAAPPGIHAICRRFPRLKLVTSEIDEGVDEGLGQVTPGVGDFGSRYYGTE